MSGRPNRHSRKPSVGLPSQFLTDRQADSGKVLTSPPEAHEDPASPLPSSPANTMHGSGQIINKSPTPESSPPQS